MIQSMANAFERLTIGQSASQFMDVDGSAITRGPDDGVVQTFTVTSPHDTKIQAKTVTVLLFDRPTDGARLRRALDAMVAGPGVVATVDGVHVCGFDTETGTAGNVELIQLSMGLTCLLLRRGSRLFADATLRLFFLNELYPEMKIVFSGAELATADALDMLQLDMPIKGLLDLTPVFWRKKTEMIEFKAADGFPKGLQKMFFEVFDITWHKDKAITKSDWGLQTLTLPQVKYAVLDAWTSEMLGLHVFRDRRGDGIYKMVFSTADHDALVARVVDGELLAKQVGMSAPSSFHFFTPSHPYHPHTPPLPGGPPSQRARGHEETGTEVRRREQHAGHRRVQRQKARDCLLSIRQPCPRRHRQSGDPRDFAQRLPTWSVSVGEGG